MCCARNELNCCAYLSRSGTIEFVIARSMILVIDTFPLTLPSSNRDGDIPKSCANSRVSFLIQVKNSVAFVTLSRCSILSSNALLKTITLSDEEPCSCFATLFASFRMFCWSFFSCFKASLMTAVVEISFVSPLLKPSFGRMMIRPGPS